MPNFFQLFKKGETEPSVLTEIDRDLCGLLGVDEDPEWWVHGWYDSIGFRIATGQPLGSEDLRKSIHDTGIDNLDRILRYLEENYTSTAWSKIGNPR